MLFKLTHTLCLLSSTSLSLSALLCYVALKPDEPVLLMHLQTSAFQVLFLSDSFVAFLDELRQAYSLL